MHLNPNYKDDGLGSVDDTVPLYKWEVTYQMRNGKNETGGRFPSSEIAHEMAEEDMYHDEEKVSYVVKRITVQVELDP